MKRVARRPEIEDAVDVASVDSVPLLATSHVQRGFHFERAKPRAVRVPKNRSELREHQEARAQRDKQLSERTKTGTSPSQVDEKEFRSIRAERVLYPNQQALLEIRPRDSNDERVFVSIGGSSYDIVNELKSLLAWLEEKT